MVDVGVCEFKTHTSEILRKVRDLRARCIIAHWGDR